MNNKPFTRPLIVVDQNKLRSPEALHAALDRCCREKLQLLVPDGVFFEMSKGSKPFDTWRRSLELLAPYRDFVSISAKMTDLMKAELSDGRPCKELTSADATGFVRRLLEELDMRDVTSLTRIIEGPLRQQLPASNRVWSDSAKHKADMQRMRDLLKPSIPVDTLKQLRQSPADEIRRWSSSAHGISFVVQGLREQGAPDAVAIRLASQPSLSASFIAAMGAFALYWLVVGGLDSLPPEKVTNDLHDVEYAVLGSLCRELLTSDARLTFIHAAVKAAVEGRALWFARALLRGPHHA